MILKVVVVDQEIRPPCKKSGQVHMMSIKQTMNTSRKLKLIKLMKQSNLGARRMVHHQKSPLEEQHQFPQETLEKFSKKIRFPKVKWKTIPPPPGGQKPLSRH